jgi:hypothetical protein
MDHVFQNLWNPTPSHAEWVRRSIFYRQYRERERERKGLKVSVQRKNPSRLVRNTIQIWYTLDSLDEIWKPISKNQKTTKFRFRLRRFTIFTQQIISSHLLTEWLQTDLANCWCCPNIKNYLRIQKMDIFVFRLAEKLLIMWTDLKAILSLFRLIDFVKLYFTFLFDKSMK